MGAYISKGGNTMNGNCLKQTLEVIRDMKVDENTNHAELSALMQAMAKIALEAEGRDRDE